MNVVRSAARAPLMVAAACVAGVLSSLVLLPTASAAANASVAIQNFAYSPQVVTITVGSSVTWTNDDGVDHTVTSLSGPAAFDSGQIAGGGTYSHRFTVVGTYTYHCADHSMMPTATVKVVPATTRPPTAHPTTHPTVRPSARTTSIAPHPSASMIATHPAGLSKTPRPAPSGPASTVASTPHVTAVPSPSASPTPGLSASPTSGGGRSHAALWWTIGAFALVAGGVGAFLRRSRRAGR